MGFSFSVFMNSVIVYFQDAMLKQKVVFEKKCLLKGLKL
jgi:hypothetical protein